MREASEGRSLGDVGRSFVPFPFLSLGSLRCYALRDPSGTGMSQGSGSKVDKERDASDGGSVSLPSPHLVTLSLHLTTGLLLSSPCLSVLSLLTSLSTYEKGSARRKETGERGEEGTDEPSEPGSDMRKEPGAVHKGTKGNGTAPHSLGSLRSPS